jgi:hypothetical protein
MKTISDWQGLAFNQVPDSDNRIHSDELAQAYGFTGALVPGVTVAACLIHPAVEGWGLPWLQRGTAHVTIKSPLYDHAGFRVTTEAGLLCYQASLHSENRLCAVAEVCLPVEGLSDSCASVNVSDKNANPVPVYQGHPPMAADYDAPTAEPQTMAEFQAKGCPSAQFLWSPAHEMAAYQRDQSAMPALLRTDGQPGSMGYANMAFLLGCANRHFAAVARMSPWIHLETRSRNFAAVASGTTLISEMKILNLFNKKGHEFADCEFNLFDAADNTCVCRIEQRAIYRMR